MVVPVAIVVDPDDDPSLAYLEVEKVGEYKISILEENFFEVLEFLDVNYKLTASSQGSPAIILAPTDGYVGEYIVT